MKLALYNLTDVVNLVELVEIAVSRKVRLAGLPGVSAVVEPDVALRLDAEYVRIWLTEQWEQV